MIQNLTILLLEWVSNSVLGTELLEAGCPSVSRTTSFSLQFSEEGALFSQLDWTLQQLAEHFTSIIEQVLAVEFNLELTTV